MRQSFGLRCMEALVFLFMGSGMSLFALVMIVGGVECAIKRNAYYPLMLAPVLVGFGLMALGMGLGLLTHVPEAWSDGP